MSRGRLITFEGGEGAGKSTQVERLARTLGAAGHGVTVSREPGGTVGAEAIRALLLDGPPERWLPLCETLLLLAARLDHVERRIGPALAAGQWVLCDRFGDSTRVYQGMAGGVGLELVDRLQHATIGGLAPDLTFVLDVPVEIGLARRGALAANRFEHKGLAFHRQVRDGFLQLAAAEPGRFRVIDGAREADLVARDVRLAVEACFALDLGGAG
ncbi:MAG TPA: dTMP kinase [Geminicoccaceae bacterium]|nr:dTMP kinase [Geminicoccaceae bacterium]